MFKNEWMNEWGWRKELVWNMKPMLMESVSESKAELDFSRTSFPISLHGFEVGGNNSQGWKTNDDDGKTAAGAETVAKKSTAELEPEEEKYSTLIHLGVSSLQRVQQQQQRSLLLRNCHSEHLATVQTVYQCLSQFLACWFWILRPDITASLLC